MNQLESGTACGALLRSWRDARKRSQMNLALDAGVSQRHLSFIESGRSHPSREMLLQLAAALELPLREQNRLLLAGGFAPAHPERSLEANDMQAVRQALEMMLYHHQPYPAVVLDAQWNLVMCNAAWEALLATLGADLWERVGGRNVVLLCFHPLGLQTRLRNWDTAATLILARLQREVAAAPANGELRSLLDRVLSMPGLPSQWRSQAWPTLPPPMLQLELDLGPLGLKLFSMISTFGTALDVTTEELRVESFFPGDAASADFFRELALQHVP